MLGEVSVDAVVQTLAAVGRESLSTGHQLVPLLFGESCLDGFAGDVVLDESIDEACIEIVAGSDSADGLGMRHRVLLAKTLLGSHLDGLCATGVNELLGIERNLRAVDAVGNYL